MFHTHIAKQANDEIQKVLSSGFLSEGETVLHFEKSLEKAFGFKNCATVNSGTAALHLALELAEVEAGDEVILPAQTFVASGLAILYLKAVPVFADIDYLTGNISVASIKEKLSVKTKAILPVHWGGYPCNLNEILSLAAEHGLKVVEDAAHALGATYQQQPIGSISDFTCFSFQAIKHLSTGDGGAICCKSTEDYSRAKSQRWFGISREHAPLTELGERTYSITKAGYKYHMNNYAAALGIANLVDFDVRLKKRIQIANYYRTHLIKQSGIRLFNYVNDRQSSYWLFGFHVEKRIDFIRKLKSAGIAASVVHQRIDRNAVFGGLTKGLSAQEAFDESQIHIPLHDALSMENAEHIINTIKQGW
ncbi:MAG: DegT/DnrJ/EryC1/StrS family aminotransferase [Bacteroidia bacterium]|jgi:perosamine synthetase|nr:DegT/DnrJ/EryC1/StrS family aminotransferase [Bacteroidia bacterium]